MISAPSRPASSTPAADLPEAVGPVRNQQSKAKFIDADAVKDPCVAAETAVPAVFAGQLAVGRFCGNLGCNWGIAGLVEGVRLLVHWGYSSILTGILRSEKGLLHVGYAFDFQPIDDRHRRPEG